MAVNDACRPEESESAGAEYVPGENTLSSAHHLDPFDALKQ
jgi:hypothetical protein